MSLCYVLIPKGFLFRVNPIYYVCFTTATIIASAIMFQGWNTASLTNTISLICGFLIIFSGVYLLNIARKEDTAPTNNRELFGTHQTKDMAPMDNGVGGLLMRRLMQMNRDDYEETVGLTRFDSFEIGSDDDDSRRRHF